MESCSLRFDLHAAEYPDSACQAMCLFDKPESSSRTDFPTLSDTKEAFKGHSLKWHDLHVV